MKHRPTRKIAKNALWRQFAYGKKDTERNPEPWARQSHVEKIKIHRGEVRIT